MPKGKNSKKVPLWRLRERRKLRREWKTVNEQLATIFGRELWAIPGVAKWRNEELAIHQRRQFEGVHDQQAIALKPELAPALKKRREQEARADAARIEALKKQVEKNPRYHELKRKEHELLMQRRTIAEKLGIQTL